MVQYRGKDVNWQCSRSVWTMINSTLVIFYMNIWLDVLQHSPNYYMLFYFQFRVLTMCLCVNFVSSIHILSTTDSQPLCWLYTFPVPKHRNWTRNVCFILPQACHNDVDCALLPYVNESYLGVLCIILCLLWLVHRYWSMSISYPHIVQGYFTDPVTIVWLP